MTQIEHVIWDWNGTILDDTEVVVSVMNTLLARRSLPLLTADRYREIFVFPVRDYYRVLGFDLVAEPFDELAVEWVAAFEGRWREARVNPEALRMLEVLGGRGMSCSVLSAAEQVLLNQQAKHFGVDHHFIRLVGIDDHHAESKLEHGRRWLEELDLSPAHVLLVGDTAHDAEVASALGVDVALIAGGHQSRRRLEETGARVLCSVAELDRVL